MGRQPHPDRGDGVSKKSRRIGCLAFGIVWAVIFALTNFMFALGDPAPIDCTGIPNCKPYPTRWTDSLLWIEIGVLIVGALIFYRAEKKDGEF